MPADPQCLTAAQTAALEIAYDVFHERGEWPSYSYVDRRLHQRGLPSAETLATLPTEFVRLDRIQAHTGHIELKVAGLARLPAAAEDVGLFLRALRWMARREEEYEPTSPTGQEQINLTSSEFTEEESLELDRLQLIRLLGLLRVEPVTRGSAGPSEGEPVWQVTVDDTIRPYSPVASLSDYLLVREQVSDANHRAASSLIGRRALQPEAEGVVVALAPSHELTQGAVGRRETLRDHENVALSSRTIAMLSAPFEGGSGPSHSSITRIWLSEDAAAYLPDEGNKAERVRSGLRTLRDGAQQTTGESLPPDLEKLGRVAEELAVMLVSGKFVAEEDVAEALDAGQAHATTQQDTASSHLTRSMGSSTISSAKGPSHQAATATAPIFLVHGHDHRLLHEVVRVIERATAREVIVLHERASRGRTLLEKFEQHAQLASFAVVLLTADDVGGALGQETKPRGRQNVIFELGFFFGKLGRERVRPPRRRCRAAVRYRWAGLRRRRCIRQLEVQSQSRVAGVRHGGCFRPDPIASDDLQRLPASCRQSTGASRKGPGRPKHSSGPRKIAAGNPSRELTRDDTAAHAERQRMLSESWSGIDRVATSAMSATCVTSQRTLLLH